MTREEVKSISITVEICRNRVDGIQMREYFKHQRLDLTRAMLAASWALRLATYCLQLAADAFESNSSPQTNSSSTDPLGGG